MMRLDLMVNGLLLTAGLGLAYWASIPADDDQEQKVDIISIDAKSISSLSLSSPEVNVNAERQAGGDRFWITHVRTEKPKDDKKIVDPHNPNPEEAIADAEESPGAVAPVDAEAAPVTKSERLLANEKFDELIKSFSPLKAERIIGPIKEDQYAEFGLDGLKYKFVINQDGGKANYFFLGKKSYGSQNRFVMETDESGKPGRVILISDQGFDNFEKANLRMHDRRIVAVPMEEVTGAEVKYGTVSKKLAHTQKDKNGEPLWSDDEEGGVAKPSYEAWMDKFSKLRLAGYADEDQERQLAGTEPFLELVLEKNGAPVDRVVFRKLTGEKTQYFIYSEFLKVHASIVNNRAEPLEKDLSAVFSDAKS